MRFGEQLRKALKEAKMSQAEFGIKFGVSRQRVHLMLQQETAYRDTIDFVKSILPEFDDSGISARDKKPRGIYDRPSYSRFKGL